MGSLFHMPPPPRPPPPPRSGAALACEPLSRAGSSRSESIVTRFCLAGEAGVRRFLRPRGPPRAVRGALQGQPAQPRQQRGSGAAARTGAAARDGDSVGGGGWGGRCLFGGLSELVTDQLSPILWTKGDETWFRARPGRGRGATTIELQGELTRDSDSWLEPSASKAAQLSCLLSLS